MCLYVDFNFFSEGVSSPIFAVRVTTVGATGGFRAVPFFEIDVCYDKAKARPKRKSVSHF